MHERIFAKTRLHIFISVSTSNFVKFSVIKASVILSLIKNYLSSGVLFQFKVFEYLKPILFEDAFFRRGKFPKFWSVCVSICR